MRLSSMFSVLVLVSGLLINSTGQAPQQDWTHTVTHRCFQFEPRRCRSDCAQGDRRSCLRH